MNELQTITPEVKDIELTATLPAEMVESQKELVDWCEQKLVVVQGHAAELMESYEYAKKNKWKKDTLKRHADLAAKKVLYYKKILAALNEGFYIVPNFPIQIFAIRTSKSRPATMISSSAPWNRDREQSPEKLPIGEGEFRNPIPTTDYSVQYDNAGKEIGRRYWAEDWDSIEFPVTMAKPHIMQVTTHAMKKKLFDRIGIMPDFRDRDPVIIGQIMLKENAYKTRLVSFMIAWHLNTSVI